VSAPHCTQQLCVDLYSKALRAAANIQHKAVKAATNKVKISAFQQLADIMHDANIKTLMITIPQDILEHFIKHWLPTY